MQVKKTSCGALQNCKGSSMGGKLMEQAGEGGAGGGEEEEGPQKSRKIRASTAKPGGEIRQGLGGITSVLLFQAAFVSKLTSSPFLASAKPYLPFLWNVKNNRPLTKTVETTLTPHPK